MRDTAGERQAPLVADGLAALAIVLAGVSAVLIFLPAEGFLSTPLHDGFAALLGRTAFVLPPLLLLIGVLRLVRGSLPTGRLVGLGALLVGVLAAEHLLAAGDAGLVGRLLADVLLAAVGGVAAGVLVVAAIAAGVWLTFGMRVGQK